MEEGAEFTYVAQVDLMDNQLGIAKFSFMEANHVYQRLASYEIKRGWVTAFRKVLWPNRFNTAHDVMDTWGYAMRELATLDQEHTERRYCPF